MADREEYDVQTLLKESLMMITDISSVAFDFAYMKKPLVYYQKVPDDKYNKGYFDYIEDGFGEVILDEENLIDTIESYFNNGFEMKDKYVKRVDESFNIRDNNNSQRIFDAIIDLIG
ncbi:CDP-glycerol glycerophosphotransferase family protein [Peptostreptococcus porci]|uniref:CDP-glycerol glycerophosphotransferase family protein n=1 Tax=Peptostreptococcus porci TaxID=2652282 RepID=UPI0023F585B9|nr:CDP-glycerol glycerophosphotransferase family protein [Peptostreptococcus porci]MDD7182833.1 CDP-glycerol glycerophosphotransferase family protein [Peptostreptococcus porci]